MGIFDGLRKKFKENRETPENAAERTKDDITTSTEKTKTETKRLTPSEPHSSARVEKTHILEGYKLKEASVHEWHDEASREAEERFKKEKGIQLPWHYNDTFGEDFKVLALRAGGVGAVFFVKSTRFGERIYAAKTLQRFLKEDYLKLSTYEQERIAKDFLEEALPWLEMGQHSNVVPVHLLENIVHPATRRNVPFIFSEFMKKGDLRHLVIEKGRLSLEETFNVGLQICEGLLHAYEHGLPAHKDLKPENIMVYKEGIYKVTDFSAGVMGTPGYMAPEQVAGAKVDRRADQFAIGLIIHDVFKGGDTQKEQIKRDYYIRSDPRRFIKEGIKGILSGDLSAPLKVVVTRCLQPRIEDRFDDISELKNELLKVYEGEFKKEYRFPEVEIDDSVEWWFNRGLAFHNIGRDASAVTPYKEALRRFKVISKTEISQARCLMNMGIVYKNTGKFSEAEASYKEALRMLKAILGTEIDQALCLIAELNQASCLMNLGNAYENTSKFSEAEASYEEALRMFKAIPNRYKELSEQLDLCYTRKHREIGQAHCLTCLGIVYARTGKFCEAEYTLKEALKIYKPIPGTEIDQAGCLMNLGNIYQSTGKFYDAKDNLKEALRMFKAIPGTEIDQARCLMNLGMVYERTDKFSEAELNLKESLRVFKAISKTEIDQARCLMNLGHVYLVTIKFSKAEANYKEALRMCKPIPGTEIDQAQCFTSLGILYNTIQEYSKVQSVLKDALEICERYPLGTEQIKNACLQLLSQIP